MAYIEVRKAGKLVMQKQVDGELARKGVRIRVGTAGNVHLKLGQSKTVGDYVVTLYEGQPSEDAYHAVDDLKKAVGAFPPIDAPKAQDVTISADAEEQKKYPRIEGFEITGRLGEGGMGTVWRGVQLSTKRQVAIKFLSAHRFASEKAKTRFEREVAMAAKLNHSNIAQIYDSGIHRGVYYYAMELIEGDHLDKYVQREELSPKEIIKLMRDVCDAVCHAHQHGIIHRDLKPSNILVTPRGKSTIVDFGLAKSFEKEHEDATISIEGDITGTPAYMAPEQAAGRIKDISERTDVYALGVIMYQLMAGCLPHDVSGSQYDVIRRIVEDDVISPRTINPAIDGELESILLTCLAREPENRYPSASVLVKDIDNYLSGEPLLSKSFSTTYRVVKKFSRNRVKIALGGTFAAMLAAIVLLLCFIYSSPRPDSKTEPTAQQDSTEGILSPNQSLTANNGTQPNSQQDNQGRTEEIIDRNQPVTVNKGPEPKARETMTNSIGMKLVYIPAGQFQMGSPLSAEEVVKQYGGRTDEFDNAPTHPVKITHGFYMGQVEATVDQFSEFVKATGYKTTAEKKGIGHTFSVVSPKKFIPTKGLNWHNPGIKQEANHPVVQISWDDATAFCQWLSEKEGKTYRLPTEAQWEYACRAGSQTEFYWGNDTEAGIAYANMCDQSAQKWADNQGGSFSFALKADDHAATTAPVGSYKPNAFGLYDMHGNVWEWCADWYRSDYYAQSPAEDPQGPESGKERNLRGASWYCDMGYYRSAYRGKLGPGVQTSGIGFRVCLLDGQVPPRRQEVDEAVVEQNSPQSLSLHRNPSPAAISIDGKPFFVICARSAVPEEFEEYKKAGFNTVQTHLPSNPALDEAQKHGLYAIHKFADYKCKEGLFLPEFWQEIQQQITTWKSHPALLAWDQSADLLFTHKNPSEIKKIFDLLSVESIDKPRLLSYDFNNKNWKQLYQYNAYTDAVILENFSIRKNIPATALWFQRAFELADGKPFWYMLHANICENKSASVRELHAAAYLGINHGATGILIEGFQSRLWAEWIKVYKMNDVPGLADPQLADLRREAIRIAGELKILSPAILAGSLKDSSKLFGNSQIDFRAFADPENITLYFIAVNPLNQLVTSTFYVPQGMGNPIDVMNEGRTLRQTNSQFSDSFEPQETHIYILKPDIQGDQNVL